MSVCQSCLAPLQLVRFSLYLTLGNFSKVRRRNSSYIKIWRDWWVLHLNTFVHLHPWILLTMGNVSKNCRGFWNIYFTFINIFVFPEKHGGFEIILKNMSEPNRPSWEHKRAHAICMLDNYGYWHTEYAIIISFLRQQCLRERAWMLTFCVYFLSFDKILLEWQSKWRWFW